MNIFDELFKQSEHQRVLATIPGSFIVGSYLINPEKANDIDIAIPLSVYQSQACTEYLSAADYVMTSKEDAEYDRSDLSCLRMTYRSPDRKINLLIITDEYIAAYKAAVAHAKRHPDRQATRNQRVEMYHYFECKVRELLGG